MNLLLGYITIIYHMHYLKIMYNKISMDFCILPKELWSQIITVDNFNSLITCCSYLNIIASKYVESNLARIAIRKQTKITKNLWEGVNCKYNLKLMRIFGRWKLEYNEIDCAASCIYNCRSYEECCDILLKFGYNDKCTETKEKNTMRVITRCVNLWMERKLVVPAFIKEWLKFNANSLNGLPCNYNTFCLWWQYWINIEKLTLEQLIINIWSIDDRHGIRDDKIRWLIRSSKQTQRRNIIDICVWIIDEKSMRSILSKLYHLDKIQIEGINYNKPLLITV